MERWLCSSEPNQPWIQDVEISDNDLNCWSKINLHEYWILSLAFSETHIFYFVMTINWDSHRHIQAFHFHCMLSILIKILFQHLWSDISPTLICIFLICCGMHFCDIASHSLCTIVLTWKIDLQKEGEKDNLPSLGSLPKWCQWLELSQCEAWISSEFPIWVPSLVPSSTALPGYKQRAG